jgi:hypothetical protein
VRGEIGVGVSGRGGGSIGEIPVFERGENERRDIEPIEWPDLGNEPTY